MRAPKPRELLIDEREMNEITPDEVVVAGITYRKRPSTPTHPCWDGGPVGGIVFVNWLSPTKVDHAHPWRTHGGVGTPGSRIHRTFDAAAVKAQRDQRREYDEARKLVEAYEAARKEKK
jgi:hypothetical protein